MPNKKKNKSKNKNSHSKPSICNANVSIEPKPPVLEFKPPIIERVFEIVSTGTNGEWFKHVDSNNGINVYSFGLDPDKTYANDHFTYMSPTDPQLNLIMPQSNMNQINKSFNTKPNINKDFLTNNNLKPYLNCYIRNENINPKFYVFVPNYKQESYCPVCYINDSGGPNINIDLNNCLIALCDSCNQNRVNMKNISDKFMKDPFPGITFST